MHLQNMESALLVPCFKYSIVSQWIVTHAVCVPQRLDIAKLNDLINKAEENMVQLRKRYESAVQERNDM